MKKHFYIFSALIAFTFIFITAMPQRAEALNLPEVVSKGHVYYVSSSGSNSAKGSKSAPFKTISYGISKLKAGDTLYIRKGTYKEKLNLKKLNGKKNNYITISSYKKEKVVVSGAGMSSPTLLSIKNSSYICVNNIEFSSATGLESCGIFIGGATHHILLTQNTIKDISIGTDDLTDQPCANGILLFGSSTKGIHDVWIYKNKLSNLNTGWAEGLSVSANCKRIYILSNTVTDVKNIGIDVSGNYGYCKDASKDFPTDCVVSNNKVSKCISPYATSYGIYVDGGQNITVSNNTVTKCSGGIEIGAEEKPKKEKYSTSNIVVKGNTVKNNVECAISVGGYAKNLGWVKNVTIKNNKCNNNGLNDSVLNLTKCNNVTIKNNVFKNTSGEASLVYSEFSSKYTKNISFEGNTFSAPQKKNEIGIKYLGKNYSSFDKWLKVVGSKAGKYSVVK
ncbi:MAG: right-handed parallel beta-helix repeat-containing protein [Lachnospiraceae bacterium]|nr:right-handed parallel beta-helix repeat-containing protein [Lachnospiraceae bacterium]